MALTPAGGRKRNPQPPTPTRPAVFVDKDGTVARDVPYNVDPARVQLTRGAGSALRRLVQAGFSLVVVSNQSGVARGYFAEQDLIPMWTALERSLARWGVTFDGFYYCPHHPAGTQPIYNSECSCRKPLPGLLVRAAADLRLDLSRSWMVGDILDDIEASRRAGCRTVLIENGNETEWNRSSPLRIPHLTASGLAEAADLIISATSPRPRSAHHSELARRGR